MTLASDNGEQFFTLSFRCGSGCDRLPHMSEIHDHQSLAGRITRISSEPRKARTGDYDFRGLEISEEAGTERVFVIVPENLRDFGREDLWRFPLLCWKGAEIAGYGLQLNNRLNDGTTIYAATPDSHFILEPHRPVAVTEAVDAAVCPKSADVRNRVGPGEPFWMAKGRMIHVFLEHIISHPADDESVGFREAFRKARPLVWEVVPGSKVPVDDREFRNEAKRHYRNVRALWTSDLCRSEDVSVELDRISVRWGLKGRADAVLYDGGGSTILELKSGRVPAMEHSLQLAGYALLFSGQQAGETLDGLLLYSATGKMQKLNSFRWHVILEGRNRAVHLRYRYAHPSDSLEDDLLSHECARTSRCFNHSECTGLHGDLVKGLPPLLRGPARRYYDHWFGLLSADLWAEESELARVLDYRTLSTRVREGLTIPVTNIQRPDGLTGRRRSGPDESGHPPTTERRLIGNDGTVTSSPSAPELLGMEIEKTGADIGPGEEIIVHTGNPCGDDAMRGRVVSASAQGIVARLKTSSLSTLAAGSAPLSGGQWFVDRLPFARGREVARKALWTFLRSADHQVSEAVMRCGEWDAHTSEEDSDLQERVEAAREHEIQDDDALKAGRPTDTSESDNAQDEATAFDLCFAEGLSGELNEDQEKAVYSALGSKPFHLIHGPPGTGKTRVLARLIRICLDRGERVLVSCPTNIALDRVLISLIELGVRDFLRIGSRAHASDEFLEALRQLGDPPALLRDLASLDLDVKSFRKRAGSFQLVGTTAYQCAAHPFFLRQRFDRVVVDEAGQMDEPSTLAPLTLAPRFVLGGDHLQLPPVVRSRSDRNEHGDESRGLERSLFERLFSLAIPGTISRLKTQYRMNREIQDIPSRLFYDSTLRPSDDAAGRRLSVEVAFSEDAGLAGVVDPDAPVVFVDVEGPDSGKSRPEEAAAAAKIVEALLTCGIPANEIGVISPYRAQQALIRNRLAQSRSGVPLPSVDTVDRFQGGEREVIILSLARSDSVTSFLADKKRLNVSLSRARSKLILLGHGAMLEKHPLFEALLDGLKRIPFEVSA